MANRIFLLLPTVGKSYLTIFDKLEIGFDPLHFLGFEIFEDPADDGGPNSDGCCDWIKLFESSMLIGEAL